MTDDTRPDALAALLDEYDGSVCPACHHAAHDPGSCRNCPRCELHTDEALAFVLRYEPSLLGVSDALARAQGDPERAGLDERVIAAFDNLGGMWSWHDPSITAPPNTPGGLSEGWVTWAGRLLREVVGRPARQPAAIRSEAPDGERGG